MLLWRLRSAVLVRCLAMELSELLFILILQDHHTNCDDFSLTVARPRIANRSSNHARIFSPQPPRTRSSSTVKKLVPYFKHYDMLLQIWHTPQAQVETGRYR